MSYSSEVLADSPYLYWRLGESSGTTAADASGNGRTGTYSGGYTLGTTGLITGDSNTAVTFNGTTALVTASDTADLTAFTIEAWIKAGSGTTGGIAGRDSTVDASRIFYIDMNGTKPEVVVFKNGTTVGSVLGPTAVNDNVRHHIVGTYDGTITRLYVDGVQVGTPSTTVSGALPTANTAFVVGGRRSGAAEFNGVIDEVAYYTTALPSTRIAAHYAAASPPPTITVIPDFRAAATQTYAPAVQYGQVTVTPGFRAAATQAFAPSVNAGAQRNITVTAAVQPSRLRASVIDPDRHAETQPPRNRAGVRP
jgi:hypothetical protein